MKPMVRALLGKTIISVQAYEDTPLYGPDYMRAMAQSVLMGGADALRACWPQDIRAIREITDRPIIGIFKDVSHANPLDTVIITPTKEQAFAVIRAGADILGIDCTLRPSRGKEELKRLLSQIREQFPEIPVMADIATLEEGIHAAETGLVDIISTTLSGYTRQSLAQASTKPDVQLVRRLKQAVGLPVNGEGRVWELADMEQMIAAGADMVTIGSAVTRPHEITRRFVDCNHRCRDTLV